MRQFLFIRARYLLLFDLELRSAALVNSFRVKTVPLASLFPVQGAQGGLFVGGRGGICGLAFARAT